MADFQINIRMYPLILHFIYLLKRKNSKQIHWHVEVYPQTIPWSGLEYGFGIFLNDLTPEKAAEELGSACRKEPFLL